MNYEYLHQSKKPFVYNLEDSICNQTTSRILQLKSPDRIRDALSPKLARDYLHNLKNFISNIDSRKPSYTSTTNNNSIHLYFPQRQNDEIKLITPQKIELKKMNKGQVKSLRYFYLKNPILQQVNEIIPQSLMTIMGDIKSGKKKLLYDLINRMGIKSFILQIDSQEKQISISIQNNVHQTIKDLLKSYKDKRNIKLTVKSDKYKIICQSLGSNEGQVIVCIHPPKQSIENCKKTLKYLEQNY